jgi:putative hydrolase of the HAD superfamily
MTVYPCFGNSDMTAKEWWKKCVVRSFELAGVEMSEQQEEVVFQRIYSLFGSQACYEIFDDALPFLHWANRRDIVCGVLSNADERYGRLKYFSNVLDQGGMLLQKLVLF